MAGLEIGLIVVGILIFIGSFFITEKLSSSDMKEITRISEDEVKNIVNKQVAESDEVIEERLKEKLDDAVRDFAVRTDDEYMAKMNQMNEYSENVLETMEKTNNEIVFIHSMLNDKQETVTELTSKMDITKSQLLQLKSDVDLKIDRLNEKYDENIKLKKESEFVSGIDASKVESETVKSFEDELIERIQEENEAPEGFKEAVLSAMSSGTARDSDEESSANNPVNDEDKRLDALLKGEGADDTDVTISSDTGNVKNVGMSSEEEEIIRLYKEGYTEIDIAKRFGKGIGEIKLVLGLYN